MGGVQKFQRARSAEQRDERRAAILAAASQMLTEMPVTAVTMNELSRRVGLAKSNIMRYFESREAVLLDLLNRLADEWSVGAVVRAHASVVPSADVATRVHQLAFSLAHSFADQEVLCDLLSAQAGVLEHNVSADVARRYKRAAMESIGGLAGLISELIPELAGDRARDAALTTILLVGALWVHTHPSPAVSAVYRSEPSLAVSQNFPQILGRTLSTYFTGLLTASP